MALDDDATDTSAPPRVAGPTTARAVQLTVAGATHPAILTGVAGDTLALKVEQALPIDTQVDVAEGALSSVGVVVWTRDDAGQTVLGVEVLGGAADWLR